MPKKSKPVLLVEDDATDVFAFKQVMANAQLTNEIVSVASGVAAVETLTGERRYAAVFTDLMLREMDGFEVISWVRDKYPDMLIVAVSWRTELETISRAFEAGAHFYILKPVREVDLINVAKGQLKPRALEADAGGTQFFFKGSTTSFVSSAPKGTPSTR
jgi:CheY-like chemotaxis protein